MTAWVPGPDWQPEFRNGNDAPPEPNPDGSCSDPDLHARIERSSPGYGCACMGPSPLCRCNVNAILFCDVCGGEPPDLEARAEPTVAYWNRLDPRYDVPRDWTPAQVVDEARRVRAMLDAENRELAERATTRYMSSEEHARIVSSQRPLAGPRGPLP